MAVLLHELGALWDHCSTSPRQSAAAYQDFVDFEDRYLASTRGCEQLQSWVDELAGHLTSSGRRPFVLNYSAISSGEDRSFQLSKRESLEVDELARKMGVTPSALYFASFVDGLCRTFQIESPVVAVAYANRPKTEFEGVIGLFVNLLPIVVETSTDLGWAQFVQAQQEKLIKAQLRGSIPLEEIAARLPSIRGIADNILSSMVFNSLDTTWQPLVLRDLEVTQIDVPRARSRFELMLTLVRSRDAVTLSFSYFKELISSDQILNLHSVMRSNLTRSGVLHPSAELSSTHLGNGSRDR